MPTLADERKALKRLAAATKRIVGMDHETWANCSNKEGYKAYIANNGAAFPGIMSTAATPDEAVDLALKELKEQEAPSEPNPS